MHLYYIFCDCLKAALLIGFLPAIAFIDSATYGQGGLKLHPKDSAV
jgi:hypothetical protein